MASFGQYPPPQSSFPPPLNQPPPQLAPLPPPPQQNWAYGATDGITSVPPQNFNHVLPSNSSFHHVEYTPSAQQHYHMMQQQYAYPPPPPPPPDSSQPPPPPPSVYYQPSQYNQYNNQPVPSLLPPPPPSSPPPSSCIPPPPPSSPPLQSSSIQPVNQSKVSVAVKGRSELKTDQAPHNDITSSGRHELAHSQKPPVPKSNVPSKRVETEEERRLRKKREFEKQRQEEKHKQQHKESQKNVLQKTQMMSSGLKEPGSILGSRMGEKTSSTSLLSGDRTENRLKKPTTFLCRMKFRNELPYPSSQPKLMSLPKDKERHTKYTITSLEKNYKPELYVEADLGIPLDLLDLSIYNPPKKVSPLDPEDEVLLRGDDAVTPVKKEGIKMKERPTDKGVAWLVKTQYISPLSNDAARQSLSEKQAKDLRESKGDGNRLENTREWKIKQIAASFEASKSRPVHATNKKLVPTEVMPLLPEFDRYEDQFVIATFDDPPTAGSELFGKLDSSIRDIHESRAIMKSFVARGSSDQGVPDKFLAYMVPELGELSKDIHDESEDVSYSWVREYNWDVRGEDLDDPTTYIVSFVDGTARYAPLPTKLVLRKKRAKEGKSGEDVEHFPVPSTVTVRKRSSVAAIELNDRSGKGRPHKVARHSSDMDDEDELSDD